MFPESPSVVGANPKSGRPQPAPTPDLPRVCGYEVQELLGHGGMGVVYKAWHLRLQRPVAVKMLLAGAYAQPHELERFLREAETVAGLRHPYIVQVHEAGDVEGRPYFTMEFVEGGSLANQLTGTPQPARQAVALMAKVAEAAHAAHQRGIVHRDLKPANILLTADGAPKLTDFGLARRLEGAPGLTQSGILLGTPSYMAPEQAQGKARDVGPAADIYALGAILYELLTGRPPFRAETAVQTLRQVVNQEPVPPTRLNSAVPRDLETICLKCLHKEPERRYASAAALGDDLQRCLEGRPIRARPLNRAARLWRWGRRNPLAAAFCLFLLASAVFSTWLAVRASRAEAQAHKRLQQMEKANDLLGSIFENLDPKEIARANRPLQAILVDKLDRAVLQLEGESIGDPLVVASIQTKFGLSLLALGEPDKAMVVLEKARVTCQAALGAEHTQTLTSMHNLALAYRDAGKLDRARPLQEETMKQMKTILGPDHPATLRSAESLAGIYALMAKPDLARPLFEETYRLRKASLGAEHPETIRSMRNLAALYAETGNAEMALPLYEKAYSLRKAILGPGHPDTLDAMRQLASTYEGLGKVDLARPLYEEALKLLKSTLGPEHPETLMCMYFLAGLYQDISKPELALPLIEEALRIKKAKLGTEHAETRRTANQLDVLRNLVTAKDRYQMNLAKLGPDHIDTLLARRDMAQLYMATNRLDEAERTLVEVMDGMKGRANDDPIVKFTIRLLRVCLNNREHATPDSWLTFRCKSLLGSVYLGRRQYADAEPLLVAGYEGMKKREASMPPRERAGLTEALERLVQLYDATGETEEAANCRKELEALRLVARPPSTP